KVSALPDSFLTPHRSPQNEGRTERPQSILKQQPAQADASFRERFGRRIERDGLPAGELKVEFQMVLQVLAHAAPIVQHRYAEAPQLVAGADPGQLQQLR